MPRFGPHIPIFDVKARRGQIRTGTALGTPITRMYLSTLTLPIEIPTPTAFAESACIPFGLEILGSVADATDLGDTAAITVDGDYAYLTSTLSDAVTVVDVSDPTSPVVVGSVADALLNNARGIVKDGDYCYVASQLGNALVVVDVSVPASPAIEGSVVDGTNLAGCIDLVKDGDYCYVAGGGSNRLTIVDVSTPASPSVTGSVTNATTLDRPTGIVKDGDYCYVTCFDSDRLTVVDVSNPASPSITGSVTDATNLNGSEGGIVKDGDYCYVAATLSDRLTVVDVSNPASPSVTGSVTSTNLNNCRDVVKRDDFCYLACEISDAVTVVDVSNPASPTLPGVSVTNATALDGALGLAIQDGVLYVAVFNTDRLTTIEIICSPYGSEDDSVLNLTQAVAVDGDYAYIVTSADVLAVIDISDPLAPTLVGSVSDGTALDVAVGVVKDGNYCYVRANGRVAVVDVSTPASPSVVGSVAVTIGNTGRGIAKSGSYVYVGAENISTDAALVVVDVSTPASPTQVATVSVNASTTAPADVSIVGTLAICTMTAQVSGINGRFAVVDISTPTAPALLTSATAPAIEGTQGASTVIDGDLVFCIADTGYFSVVDISTPASPTSVYALDDNDEFGTTLAGSKHIAKSGDTVFVIVSPTTPFASHRITAIDVSTPSSPAILGHLTGSVMDAPFGIVVQDDYAYVAVNNSAGTDRLVAVNIAEFL